MTRSGSEERPIIAWIHEHPDALVGALGPSGGPTEIPAALGLAPSHRHQSCSLLELVLSEDAAGITTAFANTLERGVGIAKVHFVSEPNQEWLLRYFDLREQYGIILRVIVPWELNPPLAGEQAPSPPAGAPEVRPRVGFMVKNEVAVIQSVDQAVSSMLGWSEEELVGRSTLDLIHPDDHMRAIDNWTSRLTRAPERTVATARLRYRRKDGTWLWLETANDFQPKPDGSTLVLTQMLDISLEMAAVEALRQREKFLQRVADTVPVGLFHISEHGELGFVNPVLQRLVGSEFLSRAALTAVLSDDALGLDAAIDEVMRTGADRELLLALGTGRSKRSARVALRAVGEGERSYGVLGCVVDVTDLRRLAETDGLTGLQNRRAILEALEVELAAADGMVTVIFGDLDGFKEINDLYGHLVGDELLTAVAARLRSALRPGELLGRLGGDEFLALCPGLTRPEAGTAIARRLEEAMEAPFALSRLTVQVGASFGVASGWLGASTDELISLADSAMYEAKQGRRLNSQNETISGTDSPPSRELSL